MLSQGKWHKKIPKDRLQNLRWRRHLLLRARNDRAVQRALVEACRKDILLWINLFVWQYNPQAVGAEVGPFITWGFQDEAVLVILESIDKGGRNDLVIEKSREMGASWLCLIVMLWLFLFHPWKKFLMISRSAEAVDKPEDPDCLFWKLDFVIAHLPDWLTGGAIKRRRMGYRNLANSSVITGQATTGKAGVGGRATAMFVDEFSQIDEGFEVLHRTADTTGCRIFNFTHTGQGTAAYAHSQRTDVRKLVMHWSQHPEKNRGLYRYNETTNKVDVLDRRFEYPPDFNFVMDGTPGGPFPGLRSPWYDAEEARRQSRRAVAMDLDIDPRGAAAQFFDAALINALKAEYSAPPYWEGELSYDRDTGRPLALEPRKDGYIKLWLNLTKDGTPPMSVYTGGIDLSTGSGATPTCFTILNGKTGEKVMEYANPFIEATAFAPLAVALCWLFKDDTGEGARIAWEMQGPGILFGKRVIEMGYRNVYYRTAEHALSGKVSDQPGWVPTPNNVRVVLEDYRAALSQRLFVNRSWKALDECLSFVYDPTGKVKHDGADSAEDPTGARENHGDRVVADALAWKMAKGIGIVTRRPEEREIPRGSLAYRRLLRDNARRLEDAWA